MTYIKQSCSCFTCQTIDNAKEAINAGKNALDRLREGPDKHDLERCFQALHKKADEFLMAMDAEMMNACWYQMQLEKVQDLEDTAWLTAPLTDEEIEHYFSMDLTNAEAWE